MIQYDPFWKTLKQSSETTYTLITKHNISSATIDRLRKNQPITTTTMNDLCRILNCDVKDIAVYVSSDQDQCL
ncbi:MAG TPA: helix-turn-helix transcriptional regulator [Candidatus Caccovicinus merdipullorum]|uniref:Helix-turn-helix transcriptional regulator n=1 Tax=Candidatus Caccovicinus merdipullorum TaxID=2840724 RepID=A0A9D1GJS0_9FIRM|nr:helix-turn-helix transcriptional regulator [Candidatus Caccovicinus merdipullorum]